MPHQLESLVFRLEQSLQFFDQPVKRLRVFLADDTLTEIIQLLSFFRSHSHDLSGDSVRRGRRFFLASSSSSWVTSCWAKSIIFLGSASCWTRSANSRQSALAFSPSFAFESPILVSSSANERGLRAGLAENGKPSCCDRWVSTSSRQRFCNLPHHRHRNRFKVHERPSHLNSLLQPTRTVADGKAYGSYLLEIVLCGLSALTALLTDSCLRVAYRAPSLPLG